MPNAETLKSMNKRRDLLKWCNVIDFISSAFTELNAAFFVVDG